MKALREFLRHSLPGSVGFALCVILIVLALGAPWLAPYNPNAQNLPARLDPPSAAHWMGTDELGRDVLSRVIYGARVSMSVSVSVVFGAGIIGLILGSLEGYFGGWFDLFVNVILINAFLSFPGILLAIAFAAFLGPGLGNVIIALTITGWAGYARLARGQVLQAKEMDYVAASRSLGASHFRILYRHLLPNIIQPVLVQATIALAGAILAESTLSFLGLGVLAPMSSWGAMLNDARAHLFDAPHMVIFPALAVMAAVLAFNLLGDALRDWMDPRTRAYLIVTDLRADCCDEMAASFCQEQIRWFTGKVYANSTVTSAPRFAPTAFAAFPRFTATSKNPLDPRINTGSFAPPLPKVCANFEISAFPTRILNFVPAITCGMSSAARFVSKFPKLSARSTTPFTPLPAGFGFGSVKRTKSVTSSPND